MNRIRELRQSIGWTQAQLGARVGMAKTTISGYEKGDHQVDPEMICKLCDLFGCTADYLLGRTASPVQVISDNDARLLEAYHAASVRDRALVDQILAATMVFPDEAAASS